MDTDGKNKHQITDNSHRCINDSSCWVSPDSRYFLYLKTSNNIQFDLYVTSIPSNFKMDYSKEALVAKDVKDFKPYFLKKESSFIYNDYSNKKLKKYKMDSNTSEDVLKYESSPTNFILTNDDKTLVYDDAYHLEQDYGEIFKVDLNDTNAQAQVIYRYKGDRANGSRIASMTLSPNGEELGVMTIVNLDYRFQTIAMNGSSYKEDVNSLNYKYIGSTNKCSSLKDFEICKLTSEINYSSDGKSILFAGKTGSYTAEFPKINIFRLNTSNQDIVSLTKNSKLKDSVMKWIVFNTDAGIMAYVLPKKNDKTNFDAYYSEIFPKEGLELKKITQTSDSSELRIFFIKK